MTSPPPPTPALRVVQGTKETVECQKNRLGEHAERLGLQWGNGQIGPKGQLRLLEAFRRLMPGIADSIVQIAGPAILTNLGEQALAGHLDGEGIAFLVHVLAPPKSVKTRIAESTVTGELQKIRNELALITQDWSVVVDTAGHSIDIIGVPRMPTSMDSSSDTPVPQYNAVKVATIHLKEPGNELRLNAEFLVMAPRRIEWLVQLVEQATRR